MIEFSYGGRSIEDFMKLRKRTSSQKQVTLKYLKGFFRFERKEEFY